MGKEKIGGMSHCNATFPLSNKKKQSVVSIMSSLRRGQRVGSQKSEKVSPKPQKWWQISTPDGQVRGHERGRTSAELLW